MTKEDGIIQSGDEIVNVKFGGGMELQQLHNTAVSILFNHDKYPKELSIAALNYLLNLFISATDALGKPIGGSDE